jgi:nucleoside phosphorylase
LIAAAFGYTCHANGLPFAVVRVLSDSSGETASDDFEENLQAACWDSFQLMDRMIPIAMWEKEHNDRRRSD